MSRSTSMILYEYLLELYIYGTYKRLYHVCLKSGCGGRKRGQRKKQWTDEAMENAINSIEQDEKSIYQAAIDFNVPRATLHRRVSGV